MKYKRYSNSGMPVWLKLIIGVTSIILVAALAAGVYLYQIIEDSKTAGFKEAEKKALQETELIKVNDTERFDGKTAYHILFGETKNGEKKVVFLPLNEKNGEISVINEPEMMPKQSIIQKWNDHCSSCKFIKIAPAMVNGEALWELTYVDDAKRYTLDYLSIYDGSRYEQFRFKRMFY